MNTGTESNDDDMVFVCISTLREVKPLVDAVERMVDISFIRSKIVGSTDKRGHIYIHTYIHVDIQF